MIEPLDLDHHVAAGRLPQHLQLPDVRPVAAAGRQEHGAVVDVEGVLPALDGPMEQFLGLALASRPAVALAHPLPQLPALARSQVLVGRSARMGNGAGLQQSNIIVRTVRENESLDLSSISKFERTFGGQLHF